MQKNDEVTLTLSRARSFYMRQTLFSINIKTDVLTVDGNEYRIINSEFRNWISADQQKLASIGGKVFGREILLINPYIGNVAAAIKNYRYLALNKHLLKHNYTDEDISHVLTDLSDYVSQLLKPDAAAVQSIIDTYKKNPSQCLKSSNDMAPYIDLEIFLAAKVGVCRHYAVFCCLVAAYLSYKNWLPAGQIILERTNLLNSAHACMHYVWNNNHWIIDPTKCLSQSTTHLAVTLVGHPQPEEQLPPTQPLSQEILPLSSQNCEPMGHSGIDIKNIITAQQQTLYKSGG